METGGSRRPAEMQFGARRNEKRVEWGPQQHDQTVRIHMLVVVFRGYLSGFFSAAAAGFSLAYLDGLARVSPFCFRWCSGGRGLAADAKAGGLRDSTSLDVTMCRPQ